MRVNAHAMVAIAVSVLDMATHTTRWAKENAVAEILSYCVDGRDVVSAVDAASCYGLQFYIHSSIDSDDTLLLLRT